MRRTLQRGQEPQLTRTLPFTSPSTLPVCLALGALLVACAPRADEATRERVENVLLITCDTLRADHVGLYGHSRDTTPHLDRWFADGAVFDRAYSTTASTHASVVSLLSGLQPQDHGVRVFFQQLSDEVELVTDHLPAGFQTAAFVSNMVLTDEAIGLADRFDHFDDFVDERESKRLVFERNARRTSDAAIRWLREERDPERPLFLWVHYIDPHGPYAPPPEAGPLPFRHETPRPIPLARIPAYVRMGDSTNGLDYVDGYDAEIRYADAQVHRLLTAASKRIDLDRSLVVFTSDHGESLMDHEVWFEHGYQVYEELVRVPLMIRGPGIPPGRHAALVSGIDLAPTILDLVAAEVPDAMQGLSLRGVAGIPEERVIFFEGGGPSYGKLQFRAARQRSRKWVAVLRLGGDRSILSRHAYDLAADPSERAPRPWPERPDGPMERLVALTREDPDPGGLPRQMLRGDRLKAPKVDPRATPEDLERLRALGYVR